MKFIYLLFLFSSILSKDNPINNFTHLTKIAKNTKFKYRSLTNMNENKPVTLDVLVIYDNSLYSMINNLTADQYFETRGELYRNNKHLMSICSWDVLPGKVSPNYILHIGPNALCIIIFASYKNKDSNHRLIIPIGTNEIMVLLNEKTFISPDNGIDYINIGQNKEFNVVENIKTVKTVDNTIPDGYKKFYNLDEQNENPAIVDDQNSLFESLKIHKINNEPIRIENLSPIKSNDSIANKEYFVPQYNSWGNLLLKKLGIYLFSGQGLIDNTVLENHGIVILENQYHNKKNYQLLVGYFKNKKYFYLMIMEDFYNNINYGRSSPLEIKKIDNKFDFNSLEANGFNGNGKDGLQLNNTNGGGINNNNNNNGNSLDKKDVLDKDSKNKNDKDENNSNNNSSSNDTSKDKGNNENDKSKNSKGNNNSEDEKNKNDKNNTNVNGFNLNASGSGNKNPSNYQDNNSTNDPLANADKEDPLDEEKMYEDGAVDNSDNKKNPIDYSLPKSDMGNLSSISKKLSPKFRWLSLLSKINNGVKTARKAVKYV